MSLFRQQVLWLIVIQQSLLSNVEPGNIHEEDWMLFGDVQDAINFVLTQMNIPTFQSTRKMGTITGLADELEEYFKEPKERSNTTMPKDLLSNVLEGIEESCKQLSAYPFNPVFPNDGSLEHMPMGCARESVLNSTQKLISSLEKTDDLPSELLLATAEKIEATCGGDTCIAECASRLRKLAGQSAA